jgi:FkbM family methyltransferase
LKRKLLRTHRYTEIDICIKNLKFKVPDAASFLFSYSEIFQEEVYYFKNKNNIPYIIDAGANIGLSIIYFKKLYPNSKILAFEADPKIVEYLKKNIISNNSSNNVNIVNKALHSTSGLFINFHSEGADAGSITTEDNPLKQIKVETVKLSEYIDKTVDFLKIDIEGAEFAVLKDISNKLYLVDKIFIEYHSYINQKQNLHQILSILNKNNFRYYLDTPGLRSQNPFKNLNTYLNMDLQVNIFAYKE